MQKRPIQPLAPIQTDEPVFVSFTEAPEPCLTARNHIKGQFLEKERTQTNAYIKDLQQTISINKQIINELLSKSAAESQNKKVIEKLNTENANLQAQLKKAIKERNDVQAKLLITEQIVEDFKIKEHEQTRDNQEKYAELVDQLNRKEFILQNFERKYNKSAQLLRAFSHKDQEIKLALKEINEDLKTDKKISNVVEDNEKLTKQLQEKEQKILDLESQIQNLLDANSRLESLLEEYKSRDLSSGKVKKQLTTKTTVNTFPEETMDKERIMLLEEELEKMHVKTNNLYKLNVRLSTALEEANKKLNTMQKYLPDHHNKNKSSILVGCLNSARQYSGKKTSRNIVEIRQMREIFDTPPKSARGPVPKHIFGPVTPNDLILDEKTPTFGMMRKKSADLAAKAPESNKEVKFEIGDDCELSSIKDEQNIDNEDSENSDIQNIDCGGQDDAEHPREIIKKE